MPTCTIAHQSFEISDLEKQIRDKLHAPMPTKLPRYVFQELAAFWQHFALHKRTCSATGQEIISVFGPDCPYPVWQRDHWIAQASPPTAEFDSARPFFEQLWQLFQQCPIPHNVGTGNENCDYTDDWWYSKNCYLSHSGFKCEDCHYCYRVVNVKDSQYCAFCFDCELCYDTIYSDNCYNVTYALYSRNCRDSAFLFDCTNCSDCLFCWNLRNKKYCIANQQYSKEEYEKERAKLSLASRKTYEGTCARFQKTIQSQAWWKANQMEDCEQATGDYLEHDKSMVNCFLVQKSQDCVNTMRAYDIKDCVDCVSPFMAELGYYCSMIQDHCYDVRFGYNLMNCQFMEYSAHCLNCKNCFGCCGLVGKQYCILNRQYAKEEYEQKVTAIRQAMVKEGISNQFFPGYFAANPYDESLAAVYWPLSKTEQEKMGFRTTAQQERRNENYVSPQIIPDTPASATDQLTAQVFWDDIANKPFQISKQDIRFSQERRVPLPHSHYVRRIKENFAWIFFNGDLRETTCAKTGEKVMTSLPQTFDGRILSEKAYLKEVY